MAQEHPNDTDGPERSPMDQFSAHLDRGWDLIHRGDLSGALMSAEKGLELDPQSPEAHNLVGFVRAAQGEPEEALEFYRQAIALDDTFVEAMLNAAEVLIHPLHEFDAAQELVEEALELAEDDDEVADALLVSFDAQMHRGDQEAAGEIAARLPQGPFENPRLDFMVGRALFEVGQCAAALELLRRAAEREPDNGDVYYFLGMALEEQEDREGATRAFLTARALDLSLPEPRSALAEDQFLQRANQALLRLPAALRSPLERCLLVVSDAPGVELVADGVDPRSALVLDAISEPGVEPAAIGRLFLYKRNIERISEGVWQLEQEISDLIEAELQALFPHLLPTPAEGTDGGGTAPSGSTQPD